MSTQPDERRGPQFTERQIKNFWSKVDRLQPADCWKWNGRINSTGYGQFDLHQTIRAHRASWEIHFGAIPAGLNVLHKCDVRNCVNPEHLFLGSHADNMSDMRLKGRGRGPSKERHWAHLHPERVPRGDSHPARKNPSFLPRGERHGCAKFTTEQITLIRSRYASGGVSLAEIGREFGSHKASISAIINRRTWRHLP